MLLTDLTRQVQRRFGDQIGSVVTQQDIYDWVNEGSLEIAKETKVNFLEQTIPLATYNLTNSIELNDPIIIEYVLWDDMVLDVKDYRLMMSLYGKLTATGRPQFYYMVDQGTDSTDPGSTIKYSLKLYPVPDSSQAAINIKVGMHIPPTRVDSPADPIPLPVVFHAALMNFCIMRAHERNKDWQGMNVAATAYQLGIAKRSEPAGQVETSWPIMEDVLGY